MSHGLNLLFVDDNLALAEVTTRYIGEIRPRWRFLLAHSLAEARMIYNLASPDAAVLDVGLPDGDGLDLLSEFKRHRPWLPIVVISGDDNEALQQKVTDRWGSGFLAKPFSAPALVNQIEWAISTSRRQSPVGSAPPAINAVLPNPHALALRPVCQTLAVYRPAVLELNFL
jgi:DNA-binding response OmpR family regulator